MKNSPKIPKFLLLDQTKLTQVLMNFMENSIKFTEKDGSIEVNSFWESDKTSVPKQVGKPKLPEVIAAAANTVHLAEYSNKVLSKLFVKKAEERNELIRIRPVERSECLEVAGPLAKN